MNNYYPLKHWLTTLFMAPLLLAAYDLIKEKSTFFTGLYIYIFLFSLLFSIPAFIIYNGLFFLLARNKWPVYITKIILNLGAICIGLVTLLIVEKSLIDDFLGVYAIAVLISSFLFNIYTTEKTLAAQGDQGIQS